MKIGIIGAGNIGGVLTRRLTRLGHDVSVANSRGPETLAELAGETGAAAVTATEAARGQDLVVVTIPQVKIPVIKAFNNIYAQHLQDKGRPHGTVGRIALPVAGDDPAGKAVVLELVDQLGFDPVDAGGLNDSWRQQPGTPVYGADFDAEGVRRALSEAAPDRPAAFRAPAGRA